MSTYNDDCQSATTLLHAELEAFLSALPTPASAPADTVRLQLSVTQLPLFLASFLSPHHTKLTLTDSTLRGAQRLLEQVSSWESYLSANQSWHLISGELSEQELSGLVLSSLSQTIHHFLRATPGHHFILPSSVADSRLPDPDAYRHLVVTLHLGERLPLGDVIAALVDRGYTRQTQQLEAGSLRVRGEVLDLRLPFDDSYYSITFYGSTIEQIVHVDGRRSTTLKHLDVWPLRFPAATRPLRELLSRAVVIRPSHLAEYVGSTTIIHDALEATHPFPLTPVSLSASTLPAASQTLVFYRNRDRVVQYLADHGVDTATLCPAPVAQVPLALHSPQLAVLSELDLFPVVEHTRPVSYERGMTLVAELQVGRPAVHSDHGIGIYEGLQTRLLDEQAREYLVLRYAAGDLLSVPVEYAHKVTGYVGDDTPTLHRLGGAGWTVTKRQAEHDALAFARDLLALAGERAATGGHGYYINPELEAMLEAGFPYPLTPDQERAWQDVRADLEQPEAMDRLIVGDVGFGKTELAIRAARHVVANGKQVAVLAPTTLLVQQHTDTFRRRLPDLADQIVTLSRFASPRAQTQARAQIARGDAVIAIGTHALLSADTTWQNLGLVIIDEEQRFGVKHKEHFKKIRAELDILSLSATPIPRTLSMALAELKGLSIISTAPAGRKSVETIIARDTDEVLRQAIERELARGGQVYVVAPKIRHLATLARRVTTAVPAASVAVAHGQLPAAQLAAIMHQFDEGSLQVLVSSTIIENGIDLPRANTILVTHAPAFGLADLYQLRGRVGRREHQGYAYFLYNQTELTSEQRQRLAALTEASRLGSGWLLAQRDLEIRGAGNLLGAAQSGTVGQVGVQLYLDMVHEAMDQVQRPAVHRHEVDIQLQLPALLPSHYVADSQQRTTLYQHLSRARSLTELRERINEVTATYGDPPAEVQILFLLLELQHVAAEHQITRIRSQVIRPPDEDPYERLLVTARHVLPVLEKVSALGTWQVKDTELSWNVTAITPALLTRLIEVLRA